MRTRRGCCGGWMGVQQLLGVGAVNCLRWRASGAYAELSSPSPRGAACAPAARKLGPGHLLSCLQGLRFGSRAKCSCKV